MGKAWMPVQNFKKVHEDGRKVILEHPDGHQVTLAKSALSEHMKGQIASLPSHNKMARGGRVRKMADGGDSSDPNQPPTLGANTDLSAPDQQSTLSKIGDAILHGGQAGGMNIPGLITSPGKPFSPAQPPEQQAPPQNYQPQGQQPGQQQQQGQGGDQSFQKFYGVQADAAKRQAMVYQQAAQQQQALAGRSMQLQNMMMKDYTDFKTDYLKGHIDPNHYMESLSTGGKIATAIGVLLGGIGGGMQGTGQNTALQFLNNQIDRDVKAQAMNMDKQVNLMKVNTQMYGNMNQAIEATRAQEYGIMSAKIQQIAAQSQSKQMQMMAQQFSGHYDQQASSIFSNLARSKAMEQMYGVKPDQMVPGAGGGGGPAYALDADAAKEARTKMTALDNMQRGLAALEAEKEKNGANIISPYTRGSRDSSMQDNVAQQMGIAEHGTRWNDSMMDNYRNQVPSPGQWKQGQASDQIKQLHNWIAQKRNSILSNQTYGAPEKPETD